MCSILAVAVVAAVVVAAAVADDDPETLDVEFQTYAYTAHCSRDTVTTNTQARVGLQLTEDDARSEALTGPHDSGSLGRGGCIEAADSDVGIRGIRVVRWPTNAAPGVCVGGRGGLSAWARNACERVEDGRR